MTQEKIWISLVQNIDLFLTVSIVRRGGTITSKATYNEIFKNHKALSWQRTGKYALIINWCKEKNLSMVGSSFETDIKIYLTEKIDQVLTIMSEDSHVILFGTK